MPNNSVPGLADYGRVSSGHESVRIRIVVAGLLGNHYPDKLVACSSITKSGVHKEWRFLYKRADGSYYWREWK